MHGIAKRSRRRLLLSLLACGTSACAAGTSASSPVITTPVAPVSATTTTTASIPPTTTTAAATPSPTTAITPTGTSSASTTTTGPGAAEVDDLVGTACSTYAAAAAALPPSDGTTAGIAARASALRAAADVARADFAEAPPSSTRDETLAILETAAARLDAAAADGDAAALDEAEEMAGHIVRSWVLGGVRCMVDPHGLDRADLSVGLEGDAAQLAAAFGSIWVSETERGSVVRIDPASGEVLARVDVGSSPRKLQPADGALWVRTADAFVSIDPMTSTVTRTVARTDVGPDAGRSWAVDGAMWICDGETLHRYDPRTATETATVALGIGCGQVAATPDLAVAWAYNEEPGESGASAAVLIDPLTNSITSRVSLPYDAGTPVIGGSTVFFPGFGGSTAMVVDIATGQVTATPDLGVVTSGSQAAVTDAGMWVVAADSMPPSVLRVDPSTGAVTGRIATVELNSVAADGANVWTVSGAPFDVLQRFDHPGG